MPAAVLKWLQSVNWKRHILTLIKVFSDFKNFGMLFLLAFIIYAVGWDTILRPNLQQIKDREDVLQKQRDALKKKDERKSQYESWEQQLKNLTEDIIPIPAGNSSTVLSVSESTELLKIARGELRESPALPSLQPPHDHLSGVSLTSTNTGTADLVALLDPNASTSSSTGSQPSQQAQPSTPSRGPLRQGEAASENGGGDETSTMPVERFDYDFKASGTYPALVDLVNRLVMHAKLVKINKIVITKTPTTEDEPDPKTYPDYPVKLDMVISLSLFLYGSEQSANK